MFRKSLLIFLSIVLMAFVYKAITHWYPNYKGVCVDTKKVYTRKQMIGYGVDGLLQKLKENPNFNVHNYDLGDKHFSPEQTQLYQTGLARFDSFEALKKFDPECCFAATGPGDKAGYPPTFWDKISGYFRYYIVVNFVEKIPNGQNITELEHGFIVPVDNCGKLLWKGKTYPINMNRKNMLLVAFEDGHITSAGEHNLTDKELIREKMREFHFRD